MLDNYGFVYIDGTGVFGFKRLLPHTNDISSTMPQFVH